MADTGTLTAALILGALTLKATDAVKYTLALKKSEQTSRDDGKNGLLTLGWGVVLGEIIVALAVWSGLADQIPFGSTDLGALGIGSQAMVGAALTAVAAVLYDAKKAVDGTDSASTPRITEKSDRDRVAFLKEDRARR